ncbi:GIY-YIG nuclease family protein [Domibacillus sp. DTU_2020_1001157_1_SI_ALB_TIR_016]|uniref:GIY-YIG nuclease family protein n=1 Tax=Domibacillus sp. DTU_2020_1001157_1_SI_ALB_TIR_016 TaxID=3077789 RepID=UPI0028EA0CBD|nr:GIY-YIG nuclease family protein [Domibacillus sp. DTU_2020_1001157_1_SI_ALB_TIR_016]WNS82204.1 GIY-YIG nuclease family protein [Domibacillus sp. DTU_2020_1001157_1_SI_ALB_TIR_016]
MLKELLSKFSQKSKPKEIIKETVVLAPQKIFLFQPDSRELESVINSSYPDGKAPGYVYFVQEHLNGSFKIGKTKHIDQRMNLFSVKLPFENELIFLIKSGNHHQTEVAFHKHFAHKRLEGEWFALTREDITWIKEKNYTEDINMTIHNQLGAERTQKNETVALSLTEKQLEYAKSMIKRLDQEYELMVDYSSLTKKDLDRLIVYFRYKNVGALNSLVKNGVLKVK